MNPITTQAQHRTAMRRVERLMDTRKLTPRQAKELAQLSSVVQTYEDKHYPMGEPVYVRAKEMFKLVYGDTSEPIFDALYTRQTGWRRLAKHVIELERRGRDAAMLIGFLNGTLSASKIKIEPKIKKAIQQWLRNP